jgi:hypothetical protein
MSVIFNALTGSVDKTLRQNLEKNPHYKAAKADLEENAEFMGTIGKVSAFIGIGSIVLTCLGIGYCAARREGKGEMLLCGAVPLAILSYDFYQASENFRSQVREDPEKLMVLAGANEPILVNDVAVKKCLLNKTLFFEPFMDYFFEGFYVINVELETKS